MAQVSQSGRQMTALRQRCCLPGPSPPTQDLGDIGDVDAQQFRDPANRLAIVSRREHV
jgi:hypothetical protein